MQNTDNPRTTQARKRRPAVKLPRIEVIEIRPVKSGSLRAFAYVRIGDLFIKSFKIVQKPGHAPFVTPPQIKSGDSYFPLLSFASNELKHKVSKTILVAWCKAGEGEK